MAKTIKVVKNRDFQTVTYLLELTGVKIVVTQYYGEKNCSHIGWDVEVSKDGTILESVSDVTYLQHHDAQRPYRQAEQAALAAKKSAERKATTARFNERFGKQWIGHNEYYDSKRMLESIIIGK